LKTKVDTLKAIKKWYSDIAELCEMHNSLVLMQDNAGENLNRSRDIIMGENRSREFLELNGIRSYSAPSMHSGQMAKVNLQSIP
jgi:hypothetical protein